MEAVCSSETLVGIYQTTCCCNTRNHNMNLHHLKNLKYYKRKVLPVHSNKAHRVRRGTAPLILNLSIRCWVVNIMPWPLYPWERTQVPIKQEAGWAPKPVYMFWRTEKSLDLNPRPPSPEHSHYTNSGTPAHPSGLINWRIIFTNVKSMACNEHWKLWVSVLGSCAHVIDLHNNTHLWSKTRWTQMTGQCRILWQQFERQQKSIVNL